MAQITQLWAVEKPDAEMALHYGNVQIVTQKYSY